MTSECNSASVPFLTADQMREVDRIAVEEYGILLLQMMENAGRSLAQLARRRFLKGDAAGSRVVVLAGAGGNGGGGLVCARRLHGWGARMHVYSSSSRERMAEVPRHQCAILEQMGVPIELAGAEVALPACDLIMDALIEYSLRGAPGGGTAALIRAANRSESPILALDVPSGVDATTGQAHDPAIKATATLTLALPMTGLRAENGKAWVGELYLGDIGLPPELYARPPLNLYVGPLFARGDIIPIG